MKLYEIFCYGIFDLDGTLVDTMSSYINTFTTLLGREPYEIPQEKSEKFYKETAGTPIDKQFFGILQKYTPGLLVTAEKLVNKFFELVDTEVNYKPFPEAKTVIEALYARNLVMFVSTGSRQSIAEKKLRQNNLKDYFSLVLGSDRIPKSQKHIEEFRKLLNIESDEFARNAFFVGDGPTDMKIAKECGIFAIGITNTLDAETLKRTGANITIKNLKELLELEF